MVPQGTILIWSGTLGSIPAGYLLCDGSNGTPDLSHKFVKGAEPGQGAGGFGGAGTHFHSVDTHHHAIVLCCNHCHNMCAGTGIAGGSGVACCTGSKVVCIVGNSCDCSPNTDAESNLPPYYNVVFIMKD